MSALAVPLGGNLSAAPTEGSDGNLYEDALTRFNDGDFAGAIIQLKNVLQQSPSDLTARILIGRAYLRSGNAEAAEKDLRRALVEGGDEELLIVPLASATYLLERYDEVINKFPTERRSRDVEAGLSIIRGQAYLKTLELEDAEKSFNRALELRPDEGMSMAGLAEVYLARSEVNAAAKMSEKAVAASPKNYLVWSVDGKIKRRFNREQDALESFNKAIELQPDYVEARATRAMILLKLNRLEDARPDLAVVLEKDPGNPFGSYIESLLKLRAKDRVGFLAGLQQTDTLIRGMDRKRLLSEPDKLLLAAVVNLALENYNDAFNFAREYVGRDRYHAGARSILGNLLLRQGKAMDAIAHLEMAAKLAPNDTDIMRQLGAAYMQIGRYDDATMTLTAAAELRPKETALRTMLAGSQIKSGKEAEAIAGLQSILEKDPRAVRPGIMLAMIMMRDRDFEGVVKVSQNLIKRAAENPVPYNLQGAALYAKGDIVAARESLNRAIELNPGYLSAHRNLVEIDKAEGNIEGAKQRLQSMLDLPDSGIQPLTELASIAVREGNLREAISFLAKARDKEPDNIENQIRLIRVLGRSGDEDAALRTARKLRDRFPDSIPVMEQLGQTEGAFGKIEDAAIAYRRMASLIRDDASHLLVAARYQSFAGDLKGAYETLNRALVIDSDHLGVLETIVNVEARIGRIEDAIQRAEGISRRFPENSLGDRLRGDIFVREQRYGDAALAYRDGLRKENSGELLVRQYLARRQSGIEKPNLKSLEGWVAENPGDYPIRKALASAYLDVGNIPSATILYEALKREQPNDPVVLNNLAGLYVAAGDTRALALAEEAYRIAPKQAETLDTLGWIHVQQGDPGRGLELLRAAYSRASRRPSIRYHLAVALSRTGRPDEARSHLEEVLKAKDLGKLEPEVQRLLQEIGG